MTTNQLALRSSELAKELTWAISQGNEANPYADFLQQELIEVDYEVYLGGASA